MAFWSTQRVEREQTAQRLLDPYDPENLHQGAYELTLSHQSAATSSEGKEQRIRGQPRAFIVAPGQFAILYNREVVEIPDGVIAFISVKGSFKAPCGRTVGPPVANSTARVKVGIAPPSAAVLGFGLWVRAAGTAAIRMRVESFTLYLHVVADAVRGKHGGRLLRP